MSKVFIEEETLIGIGNAIREKNGTTDLIATTDMATAISNLPTGGGATYPDLWYNACAIYTEVMQSQFDTSQISKLIFDYEIYNTTSANGLICYWTITAGKGYGVQAGSNKISPSCELVAIEDGAVQENVLVYKQWKNTSGSIEIDVSNFTTTTLQIAMASSSTSSYSSPSGYLHLFNIRAE